MKRVQKQVEQASLDLMSSTRVYAEAREKYEKEHAKLRELEDVAERAEKCSSAAPGIVAVSAQDLTTATARRNLQRSVTDRECRLLNQAERDCARAELALHKLRHGMKHLRDHSHAQARAEGIVSQSRVRNEERAAKRFHERRQKGVDRLPVQIFIHCCAPLLFPPAHKLINSRTALYLIHQEAGTGLPRQCPRRAR